MKGTFPIDKFANCVPRFIITTRRCCAIPFHCIRTPEASRYDNYSVHYAVKANANLKVLTIIRESGLGAGVSGGEIRAAIKAGFPADKIVFAGVGKADWEINLGLDYNIFCFNA